MRKILTLRPADNFLLWLKFDNDTEKVFDMKPYLRLPVFASLKNENQFNNVVNRGYFIEWPSLAIDLSADTLWHEGNEALAGQG